MENLHFVQPLVHTRSDKENEEVKHPLNIQIYIVNLTGDVKRRGSSRNWVVVVTLYNIAPLSALDISFDNCLILKRTTAVTLDTTKSYLENLHFCPASSRVPNKGSMAKGNQDWKLCNLTPI